jgi:hypothetical protein
MRDTTETIARRNQASKQIAAIVAASAKVATPERYTQIQQMVCVLLPSQWKFGTSRWENLVWNPTCKLALEEEMPENRDWLSPAQVEIVLAYVLYCLALELGIIDLPWNAYMRDLCFEMIEA